MSGVDESALHSTFARIQGLIGHYLRSGEVGLGRNLAVQLDDRGRMTANCWVYLTSERILWVEDRSGVLLRHYDLQQLVGVRRYKSEVDLYVELDAVTLTVQRMKMSPKSSAERWTLALTNTAYGMRTGRTFPSGRIFEVPAKKMPRIDRPT